MPAGIATTFEGGAVPGMSTYQPGRRWEKKQGRRDIARARWMGEAPILQG